MSKGQIISDVDEATEMVAALVGHCDKRGDEDPLFGAASVIGITKWSAWNLLKGRRKSIASDVLAAIRREYLNLQRQQLARLEAEVRELERKCGDESVVHLGTAVARVAERLRKARSQFG